MYFYQKKNKKKGPYSYKKIIKKVTPSTLIWKEGMKEWKEVKTFDEFKHLCPPDSDNVKIYPRKLRIKKFVFWFVSITGIVIGSFLAVYHLTPWLDDYSIINKKVEKQKEKEEKQKKEEKIQDQREKEAELKWEHEERRMNEIRANYKKYYILDVDYNYYELLGGIEDGVVKVKNNTEYPIDYICIKVDVIKADGSTYENFYIKFYDIKPYSTDAESIPSTTRGVRLDYSIYRVKATQIGLDN
jgi:hypothetical protein